MNNRTIFSNIVLEIIFHLFRLLSELYLVLLKANRTKNNFNK